jgi:hypothetical protein
MAALARVFARTRLDAFKPLTRFSLCSWYHEPQSAAAFAPRRAIRRRLDHGRRHTRNVAQLAAAVDQTWRRAGRPDEPRKLSQAYLALGPRAREQRLSVLDLAPPPSCPSR